ncbi:MAG TPA: arginine--tRNA ligase [Bacilli bacterium]|nr:arginine--tRNA ligase [Bacilli bacterium]
MIEVLEKILKEVFIKLKYEIDDIKVIKSDRPDLCDYQCNDIFRISKLFHKNPIEIGEEVVNEIKKISEFNEYFKEVEFVKPGFINIKISNKLINKNIKAMEKDISINIKKDSKETFVMDFGGANVAKPLHVGHMRTILVGESVRRILEFMGHNVISDVHLGDYGLQIGEVIYGILRDKLDINDIDIKYLDRIYPEMSKICKEDEEVKEACATITKQLQDGNAEYKKLWKKILEVSIKDIKKNYDYLGANFNYWYGESDSYNYLEELENIFENKNLLKESEGALVVDVTNSDDKKELPPLLFKKSNGAYLYASTDLATILQRTKDFNPDHILYVVDNRQSLHFEQVFRAAAKADIMTKENLEHLAYGTVNGLDGKPYKTRNGDNPKLENLFEDARNLFISKKETNKDMVINDVNKIVNAILKFADLMNCREKDYIFDLNKFSDVSGKTGPYILYTYLRINKIIKDYDINNELTDNIYNEVDRNLRLKLLDMPSYIELAYKNRMPHFVAEYVYNLCVECNVFYQNNHINGMEDEINRNDYIRVLALANKIIEKMLYLLGIEIPTKM